MPRFSLLGMFLALAGVAGGCQSQATQFDRSHEPGWRDTGTPVRPVGIDRLARYYVDEDGTLWDERGRKYGDAQ
jgi:hypothetical protein